MFERLMAQAERLGAVRRERFVERLVVRIAEDLPEGVAVAAEDAGLVLTGRWLLRRGVRDARLRSIGRMGQGEGRGEWRWGGWGCGGVAWDVRWKVCVAMGGGGMV